MSPVSGIRKIIQLGDIVIMKLCVLPRDVGKFPDGVNRSSIVPVDESDGHSVLRKNVPGSKITVTEDGRGSWKGSSKPFTRRRVGRW